MHFAIQRNVLVQSLREVGNALASRTVQTILSHICIQAGSETQVIFKATDLDLHIESISSAVVYSTGSVAVPGKKLLEVVSKLPDDLVSFKVNKETQETSIACGRTKISMAGMPAEDFPIIGEGSNTGVRIHSELLHKAISQTYFAAAGFDTGSVIGGVYISINNGEFACVATDGNRLAYRQDILNTNEMSSGSEAASSEAVAGFSQSQTAAGVKAGKGKAVTTMEHPYSLKAIIPARACGEILMMIESQDNEPTGILEGNGRKKEGLLSKDIRVAMDKGVISFQTESMKLSTRLISGEYPAFKELFPAECKHKAMFDRQELISSLDRVAVMTDEKKHLIKLHFEGDSMKITTSTPDLGQAEDEVPMEFDGQTLDMVLNVRYLLDVLRAVGSPQVVAELNGSLLPLIVKEKDNEKYKYLLMPVELKTA